MHKLKFFRHFPSHTSSGPYQSTLMPRNNLDGSTVGPAVLASEPSSNDGLQPVCEKPEIQQATKGKAQWSEHVWSK